MVLNSCSSRDAEKITARKNYGESFRSKILFQTTATLSRILNLCRKSFIARHDKMALLSRSLSLQKFAKFFFRQSRLLQNFFHQASLQIAAVHRHARCQFFGRMPEIQMTAFLSIVHKTGSFKSLYDFPRRQHRQPRHFVRYALNGRSKPTRFDNGLSIGMGCPRWRSTSK